MNNFVELHDNELEIYSGGGIVLGCLAIAGCFVGGVAVGAGTTIGIIKFCRWIKL